MTFKPGDLVILIHLNGAHYSDVAKPGAIGTVESHCDCPVGRLVGLFTQQTYYRVVFPSGTQCVNARVLRKIDPDGREVVRWEHCVWRPERLREVA